MVIFTFQIQIDRFSVFIPKERKIILKDLVLSPDYVVPQVAVLAAHGPR